MWKLVQWYSWIYVSDRVEFITTITKKIVKENLKKDNAEHNGKKWTLP